jgi:hypothetical protein
MHACTVISYSIVLYFIYCLYMCSPNLLYVDMVYLPT